MVPFGHVKPNHCWLVRLGMIPWVKRALICVFRLLDHWLSNIFETFVCGFAQITSLFSPEWHGTSTYIVNTLCIFICSNLEKNHRWLDKYRIPRWQHWLMNPGWRNQTQSIGLTGFAECYVDSTFVMAMKAPFNYGRTLPPSFHLEKDVAQHVCWPPYVQRVGWMSFGTNGCAQNPHKTGQSY